MNRIFNIVVGMLMLTGCTNTDSKLDNIEIEGKNNYTFLKYSFYQGEDGNLFEKKYIAIDEIGQERRHFFDSTMFFGEYPNRVALNKIVHIESFKEFKDTPFSCDKKHVYYVQATSDGHKRWIVEKADPKTFVPLEYRWGKDDTNIFWQAEIVEGADLLTFKVNKAYTDSASDRHSKYLNGQKIKITNR